MTERNLAEMSKEALIRELEKLEAAERRFAAKAIEEDRERLIHDLHVHQVELEMQNRELREAQARLEEVAARYSDLYDFAPVGYCTLDPEGQIRELNLTATALFGAFRETLVGSPFPSVAPLKDKRQFHAHMRRCLREIGRVTSELTFSAGKRGTRAVQIISDPVRDEGGATTAYRTILVDISDLKAMENRLQLLSTAGETLASSFEHAAVIESAARIAVPALSDMCVIDVVSESGAFKREVVPFADPKKQATLADRLMQFTPRPGWQTAQARVIASGEPMLLAEVSAEQRKQIAYDDRHADALRAADIRSLMVLPLAARGRTFGALTLASAESDRRYSSIDLQVAQDLANRIAMALDNARLYDDAQRANAALRLSEAKSSGVVSIAADAIISIDNDQRIALFNEGAERIFGYSKAAAIGAPLDILIPERFRAIHRQHLGRFASGDQSSRKMGERGASILGLRKNGEEFPADAAISKLEVGGDKVLTVALRDVTDAKRFERDQKLLADMGPVLVDTLDYEETLTRFAPDDPHSPLAYGLWYAHMAWIFDPKNDETDLSNVSDLMRFPELRLLDRFAWIPLVAYALVCYAIAGLAGVVWGFVVSTIAVDHAVFLINSLAHTWGSRRYDTPDTSRNNPLLAALTLGEGWHNNHHFYMSSARQGFFWWEIDISYYTLKLLSWLRIVRDIRQPPAWALTSQAGARPIRDPSDALPHERTDDDRVDEAGEGSFPPSDPPPWTLGRERPAIEDFTPSRKRRGRAGR